MPTLTETVQEITRTNLTVIREHSWPVGGMCHACHRVFVAGDRYCYLVGASDGEAYQWGECCATRYPLHPGYRE